MSTFQDVFPEHQSSPPTLVGDIPLPQTALLRLRRQQLIDLARAYEIPIPPGATKNQMLPPMIAAEQQGTFRTQPKHPYYLQKAARSTDTPYIPLAEPLETAHHPKVIEQAPLEAPSVELPAKRTRKPSEYNVMQKKAKAAGLNGFGLSKPRLKALLEEHGIE